MRSQSHYKRFAGKQKGLTLIELLVGITALSTVVFLVLTGYQRFELRSNVQQHVRDLMEMSIGIHQSFMMVEGTYANVNNALVIGAFNPPENMVRAGNIVNPWGGTVNVAPTGINNPNDAFTVQTTQLPQKACLRLAERLSRIFRFVVADNGTIIRNLNTSPTIANIQAGCPNPDNNGLTIAYQ